MWGSVGGMQKLAGPNTFTPLGLNILLRHVQLLLLPDHRLLLQLRL